MPPKKRPARPGPRKLPRQERSRALLDAVLEAARQVISERGEDFTLSEVAERAGVSPGSFYQYIPDRQALIGALIDAQIATDRAKLERLGPVLSTSPPEILPRVISEGVLSLYGERPRLMTCMVQLMRELGRAEDLERTVSAFTELLAEALAQDAPNASLMECRRSIQGALSAALGMVRQAADSEPSLLTQAEFRGRLEAVCRAALTRDGDAYFPARPLTD